MRDIIIDVNATENKMTNGVHRFLKSKSHNYYNVVALKIFN